MRLARVGWPEERHAASSLWRHPPSMPDCMLPSQCEARAVALYCGDLVTRRFRVLILLLPLFGGCHSRSKPAGERGAVTELRRRGSAQPEASQLTPEQGLMAAVAGSPPDYAEVAKELPLFEASGLTREKAARFVLMLKDAVERSDAEGVANLVAFPINVRSGDKTRVIDDRAEFLREYNSIMSERVRAAVLSQKVDQLKATGRGALIGDGEIRFRCPNRLLTKAPSGGITCDMPNIRIVQITGD